MATYKQNPRCAGRVLDGRAFVITPDDNKLHTLNETGALLWELAEKGCTVDAMADAMARAYEVSREQARADAERFCVELARRGILESDG